jgi:hypothetical protein
LSGKRNALFTGCLAILGLAEGSAFDKIVFHGGTQMGYTYGQNDVGWPSLATNPLSNPGRGGFFVNQLRLESQVDFDSTFMGVAKANLMGSDIQELYLRKTLGNYRLLAGKFRGAGLKSGIGFDEFELTTVNAPLYARTWGAYKRTINFRDFGIQVERDFFSGNLKNRFFFHNANGENIYNREPSNAAGPSTQALGLDYAVDWRSSPFTVWGGHVGALANQSWDEFVGPGREGWEVGYWFKTNPLVDGSLSHQMDLGRFHMFNEALVMLNRTYRNPVDSGATKTWGASSLVRFDLTQRWESYFRYEFFDNTDGFATGDALHLLTFGGSWRPSPSAYKDLKVKAQYVRTYEEGVENTVPNDLLYCQLQMLF